MNIRDAYDSQLEKHGHVRDAAQDKILELLADLQVRLQVRERASGGLLGIFRRSRKSVPGLYIWGGVGRGKTFLMDLFFETLSVKRKRLQMTGAKLIEGRK